MDKNIILYLKSQGLNEVDYLNQDKKFNLIYQKSNGIELKNIKKDFENIKNQKIKNEILNLIIKKEYQVEFNDLEKILIRCEFNEKFDQFDSYINKALNHSFSNFNKGNITKELFNNHFEYHNHLILRFSNILMEIIINQYREFPPDENDSDFYKRCWDCLKEK